MTSLPSDPELLPAKVVSRTDKSIKGTLVVQWLRLRASSARGEGRSLVGEIRSHMLRPNKQTNKKVLKKALCIQEHLLLWAWVFTKPFSLAYHTVCKRELSRAKKRDRSLLWIKSWSAFAAFLPPRNHELPRAGVGQLLLRFPWPWGMEASYIYWSHSICCAHAQASWA